VGRFTGWNEAAVVKLAGVVPPSPVKRKQPAKDFVGQIAAALNMLGIKCEREYRFIKDRRFRFDIALPDHKIAIEFEGGVYSAGRHTRSTGYINDAKKYNLATMHGWKLMRYTTEITKELNWEFRVADEVKRLIENKN
jgi:very-short-patch-repair endonuclease